MRISFIGYAKACLNYKFPCLFLKKSYRNLFIWITAVLLASIIFAIFLNILILIAFSPFYPGDLYSLIGDPSMKLKSYEGRTNILFLGVSPKDHESFKLTDAILLLSVDFQNKDVRIVSVPRDIWSDNLQAKINSAYYYGEKKGKGEGQVMAKAVIKEISSLPMSYILIADYELLEKAVDIAGGITVWVEESFTDDRYPVKGKENDDCGGDITLSCRYETVVFEKGNQVLNGKSAVKFVRSRNALGDEGTDIARGKRQQLVIASLKNKILDPEFIIFSPNKLYSLYKLIINEIITDVSARELLFLTFSFLKSRDLKVESFAVDYQRPGGTSDAVLVNPDKSKYQGLWVLYPKGSGYSILSQYFKCKLYSNICRDL